MALPKLSPLQQNLFARLQFFWLISALNFLFKVIVYNIKMLSLFFATVIIGSVCEFFEK